MAKLTTGIVRLSYANIAQPRKTATAKQNIVPKSLSIKQIRKQSKRLNVRLKNLKRIQKQ